MTTLTEQDYQRAAESIGSDTAAIKAVVSVESSGRGFFSSGRPKILFEAHWFSRFTDGRYNRTHPKISSPRWNRALYKGGEAEYSRLEQAKQLDETAALKSASWGLFQIMGFNFQASGYDTVQAFVDDMNISEGKQLDAFVNFIKSQGLDKYLIRRDWVNFARRYNGPGYRQNRYDTKLARAYRQHSDDRPVSPPRPQTTPRSSAGNPAKTYHIKAGDTLSKVATKYFRGNLNKLLQLNPQISDPDRIQVGQVVRLG